MENTSSMSSWRWDPVKQRKSERINNWNKGNPTYTYSLVTVHGTATVCYRSGARVKPALYMLPKYSTPSSYRKFSIAEISAAAHRTTIPSIWDTSLPFYYGENLYSTTDSILNKIAQEDGLETKLVNKFIDEVMQGKGQLANDLLEIGKTKAMFVGALRDLRTGFREIRRGQPFNTIVRSLKKEGWNGVAGRRFLEFTYGWAPTIKGAFETADTLGRDFLSGKVQVGRVRARSSYHMETISSSKRVQLTGPANSSGFLTYQYTVRNAKLALLSSLGLTNPAAIIWEATPWSFVFDWAFGFGSYLQSMDWNLGLSDIYYQTSVRRKALLDWQCISPAYQNLTKGRGIIIPRSHARSAATKKATYSWKGIKNPFASKNSGTRLAVSLALLDQQRTAIRRV